MGWGMEPEMRRRSYFSSQSLAFRLQIQGERSYEDCARVGLRGEVDVALEIGFGEQFNGIGTQAAGLALGGEVAITHILLYEFRNETFVEYPE